MTSSNKHIAEDEIDLVSLRNRLLLVVTYPFALLFRNKGTTVLFILFGLGVAAGIRFASPKTYRSSFIIRPNDRTERFHLKIFGDLAMLAKERNTTVLSKELGLDQNTVNSLLGIESIYPAIKFAKDTVHCTEVFIQTTDPSLFIPIQTALIAYLEHNPYYAQIHAIQKAQVEQETQQVEADLRNLDSLKQKQLRAHDHIKSGNESSWMLAEMLNPASTYTVANERFNKRMQLIARSYYLSNFQLVKSCLPFQKPYWPPRFLFLCLVLVPASLVLCMLFLLFRGRSRHAD